jgi:hypothetical protein
MQRARSTWTAPRTHRYTAAVASASALLALVGCTMVGDRLNGVALERGGPTTCIKQCNDLYRVLIDQEQKVRATNVERCLSLPQPERGACLEAEGARHAAEMERLSRARTDCQDNCHDQGVGSSQ